MTRYTFGDSDLARERLAIVADTFAAPTRALLARPAAGAAALRRSTWAAGPGTRPRCCATAFPHSEVTGLDASPAMVDEARGRVPGACVHRRRRDRAAAAARRPRVRAACCSATCPTRRRARALGRGAAPARRCSCARSRCATAATIRCSRATRRRSPRSSPRAARRCGPRPRSTPTRRAATRVLDRVRRAPGARGARGRRCSGATPRTWRDRTPDGDALIEHCRALEQSDPRRAGDVGAAPDRVSGQAAAGDAGLLQDLGRHAELAPRAVGDPLALPSRPSRPSRIPSRARRGRARRPACRPARPRGRAAPGAASSRVEPVASLSSRLDRREPLLHRVGGALAAPLGLVAPRALRGSGQRSRA